MSLYCYLAGPVEFDNDNGKNWREDISKKLKEINIIALNPMIKPDWLLNDNDKNPGSYAINISKNIFSDNNIKINNDIEELINIRLYCMSLINMSDFTICRLTKTITAGTYEELGIIKTQNKPVFILSPNEWVPGWVYSMFPNTFYYDNDEEKLLAKLKSIIENKQNLSKKEKLRWLRLFWE